MKRLNKITIALFASATLFAGCEFQLDADVDVDARDFRGNNNGVVDPCIDLMPSPQDTDLSDAARQALNHAYEECITDPPIIDPPTDDCNAILGQIPIDLDPQSLLEMCGYGSGGTEPGQPVDPGVPGQPGDPGTDPGNEGGADSGESDPNEPGQGVPMPPIDDERICDIVAQYHQCLVGTDPPVCEYVQMAANNMDADDATQLIENHEECFPTPNPCDRLHENGDMNDEAYWACVEPQPCDQLHADGQLTDEEYQNCVEPQPGPCDQLHADGQISGEEYQNCVEPQPEPVEPCDELLQNNAPQEEYEACLNRTEPHPCDDVNTNGDVSDADYQACLDNHNENPDGTDSNG